MSDPVPQSWFYWAVGTIGVLCGAIATYFRRKFDHMEERQAHFATHDELAQLEMRIEARALAAENRGTAQHADNTNNFRELRLQLESVNTKLFELAAKK